jgi:hypothetical protein
MQLKGLQKLFSLDKTMQRERGNLLKIRLATGWKLLLEHRS